MIMTLGRKLLWMGLGLLLLPGALLVLGVPTPRAYANVTLISFTGETLIGLPEIYLEWETATEIDTAGFYIQRSPTGAENSYARVSPFIPTEGDSVTGALYDWLDDTTTLGTKYYYLLEEVPTNQAGTPETHGPVVVTAGVPITNVSPATSTPTHTATPTPTMTRTPTLPPSSTPTTPVDTLPEPTDAPVVIATPQLAVGATVTPRSTTANRVGSTPGGSAPTQAPTRIATAAILPSQSPLELPATPLPGGEQPPVVMATPLPLPEQNVPATPVMGEPVVALISTEVAPPAVQPLVIVTATPQVIKPVESRSSGLILLIGAAMVLLAGAFVLLRQASK